MNRRDADSSIDHHTAASPAPRPNPGSREALEAGCVCAVMDNNHGKFAPHPPNGWWITEGCPVHTGGET